MAEWIGENGEFIVGETMPPDLQELVRTKGVKDVSGLAEMYNNLEKKVGLPPDRVLSLPADKTDEAGWLNVYSRLGLPESPDKYELKVDNKNIELNDELIKAFRDVAHKKLHLNNEQFNEAVQFQIDAVAEINKRIETEAARQQVLAVVDARKRHNISSDEQWTSLIGSAQGMAQQLKIDKTLEKYGLNTVPEVIDMLLELKDRVSKEVLPAPLPPSSKLPKDERINQLMKSEAFVKATHPDHEKAMKEFFELHEITVRM